MESIARNFGCLRGTSVVGSLLNMVGFVHVRNASLGLGNRANEKTKQRQK